MAVINSDRNPQKGQMQGTSNLYDQGTTPNTRVAVSQRIRILTPAYADRTGRTQVGVVASMTINQSRTIDAIRGIGFGDHIAELVPGVTDPETADMERSLLYLNNIWQADILSN